MKAVMGDIIAIFLILLLIVPVAISESKPLRILNAQGAIIDSIETLENQGARYVQLLAVTKLFDGNIKSDPLLKRMTVNIKNNDIVLNIDRQYLRVNDEEYVISNPPINVSGKIFVPIEFLTEILPKVIGKPILLDREKWTLQVDVRAKKTEIDEKNRQNVEVPGPIMKTFKLILDPGHGGSDTGAKSERGVMEKDLTLVMAQKIRDILKQQKGLEVFLTRSADDYVALEERTNIANRLRGDLFLSIHFNWSYSKDVSGFRIYVNGEKIRMGQESELEGVLTKFREEKNNTAQKFQYLPKSRNLAKEMANGMKNINLSGQYNSEASLAVMDRLSMPGVLMETLYLSNPKDVEFLSNADSIDLLAQTLCESLLAYISKYNAP